MPNFQGTLFIVTRTLGHIFKSALVYLYWSIKFPQQNINQSKLGLVIRICQWNCCQFFSENLLLRTFVICSEKTPYVFEMRILSLRTFIQTTLSLTEFVVIFALNFAVVTEPNKCLSIFPPRKQMFYYLPDLRN